MDTQPDPGNGSKRTEAAQTQGWRATLGSFLATLDAGQKDFGEQLSQARALLICIDAGREQLANRKIDLEALSDRYEESGRAAKFLTLKSDEVQRVLDRDMPRMQALLERLQRTLVDMSASFLATPISPVEIAPHRGKDTTRQSEAIKRMAFIASNLEALCRSLEGGFKEQVSRGQETVSFSALIGTSYERDAAALCICMADIRYARPVLDDMVKRSEELISTRIRIRESLSSAESIFKASKELELRMRALSEENQTRHNELAICIEHLTKHVSEGVRTSIGVLNETLDREGQTLPEAPAVIEVRNQLVDILGGTHSGVSERELDRLEAKYRSHGVLLKQLVGYQAQCLDATLPPVHAEHSRIVTAGGGGEVMPLKGGMLIPMFWNVRRLLPDEVRRVDEIELQNFPWERFTEEINETESQLEVRTWGVVSNGRVVGYVRWRWANEGSQIERIYVEEDFRRRGIGKAMCESVLKHSGSPPSLTLMTREGDKEVREFLEKTGFRAIGISREAFIDPAEDGFVWRSVARPW